MYLSIRLLNLFIYLLMVSKLYFQGVYNIHQYSSNTYGHKSHLLGRTTVETSTCSSGTVSEKWDQSVNWTSTGRVNWGDSNGGGWGVEMKAFLGTALQTMLWWARCSSSGNLRTRSMIRLSAFLYVVQCHLQHEPHIKALNNNATCKPPANLWAAAHRHVRQYGSGPKQRGAERSYTYVQTFSTIHAQFITQASHQ